MTDPKPSNGSPIWTIRVGLPVIVDGKIGILSPRPGSGNTHPKDWFDYKEPIWDFIPLKMTHTKYDEW
jgi:hypothetical protein